MRNISSFIIALLFIQLSFGQVKVWKNSQGNTPITLQQWEVNDVVFQTKRKVENPLLKEAFAIVSDESGEVQRVPLFYNDNNQWVLRYSSAKVGKKTFVLESEMKELNGKKGMFRVSENKKKERHGGIVLNKENPRHFFYEDGSHYFNLAFECDWLFALD